MTVFKSTELFMRAAGQLKEVGFPADVTDPLRHLRVKLLAEEASETFLAESVNDEVGVADGLADVIVIAYGSMLAYWGPVKANEILGEVARSNLSKIVDGKVLRRDDGKILKPDTYSAPDIRSIIKAEW